MKLGFWKGWGKPFSLGVGNTGIGESDDIAPTCTISSSDSDPTIVSPITFTYVLSEPSSDFTINSITIGNGTKDTFSMVDSTHYTLTVIPNAGATVTSDVAANAFHDAAGNGNTAATQYTVASKVLLFDNFTDTVAAGMVSGTAATPGPGGNRVVRDANSKFSVGSDVATWATGGTGTGDPGLWYSSITRGAGAMYMAKTTPAATTRLHFGFDSDQAGAGTEGFRFFTGESDVIINGIGTRLGFTWANGTTYVVATVLRSTGLYQFVKTGSGNWKLWMYGTAGNTSPLFPTATPHSSTNSIQTADFIRAWKSGTFLPTPLAYDTFTRANGALGSSETSGPDSQAVSARTWTTITGTWAIASNAANCSATNVSGTALTAISETNDDVFVSVNVTRSSGRAGLVLRYQDINNYLYAYHDGTNAALIKRVAGVESNVVAPISSTYSAGAPLAVLLAGTGAVLYYNNLYRNEGVVPSSTYAVHGLYSNDTNPTLDNFLVLPHGTDSEYSALDSYAANFVAGGGLTPLHEYSESVLALNPIAYWPCNEWFGSELHDESGNNRTCVVENATLNTAGKYGAAIQFLADGSSKLTSNPELASVLDMREYSVSAWIKMNVNPALQVRWFNVSTSSPNEYSVLEVRNGDDIAMFTRQSGNDQDVSLAEVPDDTWVHIVQFNSESTGKCGMYMNGVLYEFTKTIPGLTNHTCDAGHPNMFFWMDGYAQHIAWFDHKLSQIEVNSICT